MTGYISESTKRIVRQNDGFGCCVCGFPIIDYHHIVPDSTKPEEIMLLCPNHHREATLEAVTIKEQNVFKKNPFNIQHGFVEGKLKINQIFPVINIGNNIPLVTEGDLVIVENESIFGLEIIDGRLNLSLKLRCPSYP